jgi:hypothetical protein
VEFDAVTKDRAHGRIEVHEGAPDKLAIVEKDAHSHPDGNGRRQEVAGEAKFMCGGGDAMESGRSSTGAAKPRARMATVSQKQGAQGVNELHGHGCCPGQADPLRHDRRARRGSRLLRRGLLDGEAAGTAEGRAGRRC